MLQPGDRIGPLRVERPLGAGGMGEVYLARDERLERMVALKLLPASRSIDPGARGRMLREARAASALKHPSIVTVYDIGEHDGLVYIVMEHVDGETFDALVRRRGKLPADEAVALFAQVGDAVSAAHAAGVLHRDLKSVNLMIDRDGRAKVLDFGLSKRTDNRASTPSMNHAPAAPRDDDDGNEPTLEELANAPTVAPASGITVDGSVGPPTSNSFGADPQTVHGARMGTPGWAPPELMEGRPADERSDVFALGCVLYHLLAGQPPFAGTSWSELRAQVAAGPAPLTGVPPALAAVVRGALSEKPADRPASVQALMAAARAATGRRSRRGVVITAAGGVALIGVGIAVSMSSSSPSPDTSAPKPVLGSTPARALPPVPRRLTKLGGCAYSPMFLDEDTVVFDLTKTGAVDLYRLDLGGSAPVQLTRDPGWEWRASRGASATEIVFVSQASDANTIATLDLASGARRTLTRVAGPVAFARGAYYYGTPGASVLRRHTGDRDEAFLSLPAGLSPDTVIASPDGSRLGIVIRSEGGSPKLCTTLVDPPELACLPPLPRLARPAFSSKGDALYFVRNRAIWRQRVVGGDATLALADVLAMGGLAVSPSGRSLVYSDCGTRVVLADVVADPNRSLVQDPVARFPSYGPAGVFAYLRVEQSEGAVMLRERTGVSREIYRRDGAQTISDVELSPDGSSIAFVVSAPDEGGIYLASTKNNAPPNRLTEGPSDSNPVFVGDDLLFTRHGANNTPVVMRVARDGSTPVRVSTRPRHTIAAAANRVLLSSPGGDYLYWWDPATGRERPGPPMPPTEESHIAMSPNGRWILVLGGNNSGQEIWRVPSDGAGKPELVHKLPEHLSSRHGAIDDNGHPLIAIDTWAGDLWLASAPDGTPW